MLSPKDTGGLIIIDKDGGITSQGAVNRVKRLLGVTKAGHTGTLDPMATGVLPVLVGRGVKASEFMLSADKHYGATLKLGLCTDTEDVTGATLSEHRGPFPTEEEVRRAIDGFVGKIMQTPPMYSALKVGGRKLCDLARAGVEIDRSPRPIEIFSIEAEKLTEDEYFLDVRCSGGTYIRTLCADIGAALGVGGCMKTLRRLSASGFALSESVTLEELEGLTEEERWERVLPVEAVFEGMPSLTLPPFFARLASSGCEIYLDKLSKELKNTLSVGTRVKLYSENGFFALAEVREYEQGPAAKPIRQFLC